jgi:hypothetical protein
MVGKWLGVSVVAAVLVAGCGQGTAGFDVDLYSFLTGAGNNAIPYFALPNTSISAANTATKVNLLPGLGSSLVDTVRISGTMDLRNQTGSGTVGLQIFLAADSAGTSAASAAVFNPVPSAAVSGANTSVLTFTIPNLTGQLDSLFTKSSIWVRMQASVSNPSLTTSVQGTAVLTGLQLRLVVQDKVF